MKKKRNPSGRQRIRRTVPMPKHFIFYDEYRQMWLLRIHYDGTFVWIPIEK